jgi:D-threo-aldose 1-dehydrogenase
MRTRPLGRTDVTVSEIGFGSGPLGGFYGPVGADRAAATVHAAWQGGIRYFDTAPLYGYGQSELRLGHVLREHRRDDYVLSTKVARHFRPLRDGEDGSDLRQGGLPFRPTLDYSRDGVRRSLEQSFLRLGLTRADIVMIHDVDAHQHGDEALAERYFAQAVEGCYRAVQELKESGGVKAVGIGLNQPHWALRWLAETDLDCVMIAGRYTLLNQEAARELLPLCQRRGVGVLLAGAFNGGILARGPAAGARYNYKEPPPEILAKVERVHALAALHGVDIEAAAIRFCLGHPAVSSLVIGAMSPAEVERNLEGYRATVPGAFFDEMRAEGLIEEPS